MSLPHLRLLATVMHDPLDSVLLALLPFTSFVVEEVAWRGPCRCSLVPRSLFIIVTSDSPLKSREPALRRVQVVPARLLGRAWRVETWLLMTLRASPASRRTSLGRSFLWA